MSKTSTKPIGPFTLAELRESLRVVPVCSAGRAYAPDHPRRCKATATFRTKPVFNLASRDLCEGHAAKYGDDEKTRIAPAPTMPQPGYVPASEEPAPWGYAHRREALRRTYEIAAWYAAHDLPREAQAITSGALVSFVAREAAWRFVLSEAGLDAARVDREARRVRGLAEGRLVRETRWEARFVNGSSVVFNERPTAATRANILGSSTPRSIVRVTRIRRA